MQTLHTMPPSTDTAPPTVDTADVERASAGEDRSSGSDSGYSSGDEDSETLRWCRRRVEAAFGVSKRNQNEIGSGVKPPTHGGWPTLRIVIAAVGALAYTAAVGWAGFSLPDKRGGADVAIALKPMTPIDETAPNGSVGTAREARSLKVGPRKEYCVIQITTPANAEARRAANFVASVENENAKAEGAGYLAKSHVHVNGKGMHANLMFDALVEAGKRGCDGEWFFIGDDDTLFYRKGIEMWMRQREPQKEWRVAHGNLYEPQKLADSWFTGGSGIALTRPLVQEVVQRYKAHRLDGVIQQAFSWCGCMDVPFTRALSESGGRVFHQPNLFLDSCLDCDRRGIAGMPIVGCHAGTMFRASNPPATTKHGDAYGETPREQLYSQHPSVARMTPSARRKWFDDKCEATKK